MGLETFPPATGNKLVPQFSGYQYSSLLTMQVADG